MGKKKEISSEEEEGYEEMEDFEQEEGLEEAELDELDEEELAEGFGYTHKEIAEDDEDLAKQQEEILINAADEQLAETDTQLLEMKI